MGASGLWLTIGCIAVAWPGTAAADRHCAPSADQYYAARLVLLEANPNEAPAVERAIKILRSALAEAAICGCPEIHDVLDNLYQRVGDPEMTAEAVTSAILAEQHAVDTAIIGCHS